MTTTVETPDGRSIGVHEAGDPDGFPVVYHHGTPGSGLLYESWATPGIRLIGYDRAGYGASTRKPGRAIADVAADVDAIADALGLDRFGTWGLSGGGPHALATGAGCSRVVACASVAGVAPWGAEGLDWLAGMGDDNVKEFDLVLAGEEALRPAVERDRDELRAASADDVQHSFETLLGEADRRALTGELAAYVHESMARGLERTADGWLDDDLAFVQPWGFDLTAIPCPVLVVQGGDDRFVPKAHGEWLAAHIPDAEAWIDDENGHLTMIQRRAAEVQDWLRSHS